MVDSKKIKNIVSRKNSSSGSKKSIVKKKFPNNDPFVTGLINIRNYYNTVDFASGGLLKFFTLLYGVKVADNMWRYWRNKEIFSDSRYAAKNDSIIKTIERINFLMYGKKDIDPSEKPKITDIDEYKKNLTEINLLTYKLHEIDNLYTGAKKEPFFSPLSAIYVSEHSVDGDTIKVKPHMKAPDKTTVTVTTTGGGTLSKQFGKRHSEKRRSKKRQGKKRQGKRRIK